MTEKAPMPLALLDKSVSTPLLEAWYEIVHLKQLFRKGWLQRELSPANCESVAEHTFGNAMLCLLFLPSHPDLDPLRVLKMALIHDVGEAYVGDITPTDGVPREVKRAKEAAAIEKILGKLPHGADLIQVWEEYESQQSDEAKFVKQIDRLEFAFQASVYEHQGMVDGSEFYDRVEEQLHSEPLKAEMQALRSVLARKQ